MTKVSLVAGASGFLGSNLCRRLLREGHRVIGVDNHATGTIRNLDGELSDSNFEFIEASILEVSELNGISHLDYVFHFASPASPPKYQALGLETLHVNTLGTENLLKLARKHSSRLVFASTSEVYGDPAVSPQPESYWGNVNPIGPRSVYDESKRLGETLVSHYSSSLGVKGSIVRIFNTYGPGMDPFDGRVVSTFIRQALADEPFTVFGNGSQTRSFCFVDDLIEGIWRFSQTEEPGPMNLGNPIEIDLMTLGKSVASVLGVEARFEHLPLPVDDPKQRRPDISLAKSKLGWEPKTTLDAGIQKTAHWMAELGKGRTID
jgi:dTDP-glucose 4,6-dehydratase